MNTELKHGQRWIAFGTIKVIEDRISRKNIVLIGDEMPNTNQIRTRFGHDISIGSLPDGSVSINLFSQD